MEHQFVGLSSVELSRVHCLMLRVQALQCLTALNSAADMTALSPVFLAVLNKVNEYVTLEHFSSHCHLSLFCQGPYVPAAAAGGANAPAYWAPASLIRPTPKKTPIA